MFKGKSKPNVKKPKQKEKKAVSQEVERETELEIQDTAKTKEKVSFEMVPIEKDIPMPEHFLRKTKYPWDTMEVKDSFFSSATIGTTYPNKRFAPKVFKTFKLKEGGYRVWRVS